MPIAHAEPAHRRAHGVDRPHRVGVVPGQRDHARAGDARLALEALEAGAGLVELFAGSGRGHPVWAEVDLGALRHNVRTLRGVAPTAELMGVVKGYAYGHGNPECATAMLETVARPRWLSGTRNASHQGCSTAICSRTIPKSGVVGGSISHRTSNAFPECIAPA